MTLIVFLGGLILGFCIGFLGMALLIMDKIKPPEKEPKCLNPNPREAGTESHRGPELSETTAGMPASR